MEVIKYPSSYGLGNIISVAATKPSDALAAFSTWNSQVHLGAPGCNIQVPHASGDAAYSYASGTSFSCPIVAGAAALLLSAAPDASIYEVRAALLSSVDPVPVLVGKVSTGGRLNVARALATLLGLAEPPALPPPQCECLAHGGARSLCRSLP